MHRTFRVMCLVILVVAAVGQSARAQVGIPSKVIDKGSWPTEAVNRTSTIPAGMLEIDIPALAIWDGGDCCANAYELTPGVEYGVSSQLQVGASLGLAIAQPFNNFGPTMGSTTFDYKTLAGHVAFRFLGAQDVNLFADLPIHVFDPFALDFDAGVGGRMVFGQRAALFFQAGISDLDLVNTTDTMGMGTVESNLGGFLNLRLLAQSTPNLALGVENDSAVYDHGGFGSGLDAVAIYGMPGLDLDFRAGLPDLGNDVYEVGVGATIWR